MELAIQTEHLTKVYQGRVIAVNDLTLTVPQGITYGLLGPNGAGKTTTLRLLLGLQRPTAGLEPAARRFTLDLIRELAGARTVLVATHILSDIDQICDHVRVMLEGRMISSGTIQDMRQRLRGGEIRLELGGSEDRLRPLVQEASGLDGLSVGLLPPERWWSVSRVSGRGPRHWPNCWDAFMPGAVS